MRGYTAVEQHQGLRSASAAAVAFRVLALFSVMTVLFPGFVNAETAADELAVKSTFVLNFLRLVNWTEVPGEVKPSELPVCSASVTEFFLAVRKVARPSAGGQQGGSC